MLMTEIYIPLYVCFIASLGPKFSYIVSIKDERMFKYLLVYEKIKTQISDFFNMRIFHRERNAFKAKLAADSFSKRTCESTKAQKFILLLMKNTRSFLIRNPHVKIFPADKGGKVVITDMNLYSERMNDHLLINLKKGVYYYCEGLTFEYIRDVCESKYRRIRDGLNAFFKLDDALGYDNVCKLLSFEPFVISRLYGYFKIHKDGSPARPIISATDCMGKPLATWFLAKLNIIADELSEHRIKSADELFRNVNDKVLDKDHVLVTWDYDNMFTNIPFDETKMIIRKYYYLIEKNTSVPVEEFLNALSFIIEECAFFSFNDKMYMQAEGLAMGNSLSQVLAEITTSYFLNKALLQFDKSEISFIYKYVDDIIGAINKNCLDRLQKAIESLHSGMKLKMQNEDHNGEVIYLQMKIGRNAESNNSVYARWFQKEYCSKRILDFHSYHPQRMKDSVVKEFISSVLKISSNHCWKAALRDVRKTLRNSNYPNGYIDGKVTSALRDLNGGDKVRCKSTERRKMKNYVSFPYYPSAMNFTQRSIKRMNFKSMSLAPTIISSNAKSIFANLKDKRSLDSVKNASFLVRCKDCEFSVLVYAGQCDVNRKLSAYLNEAESEARKHCNVFNHVIDMNVKSADVIHHKNDRDLELMKALSIRL